MLAIAANTIDAQSETFIRAHATHIEPGRTLLICCEDGSAAQFACTVLSAVGPLLQLPERVNGWLRHPNLNLKSSENTYS